jgi:general secretion pathway protein E/type IV pilus assembly protein PilB
VAEVLLVDELLDEAIARGAGRAEVRSLLRRQGFRSIVDYGLAKVLEGVISLDSLARAADLTGRSRDPAPPGQG